ncbi:MAG TPA: flagellar basal body-associated protein FliL [Pseudolabrys sp.]|jgi:flagellar FliL protein
MAAKAQTADGIDGDEGAASSGKAAGKAGGKAGLMSKLLSKKMLMMIGGAVLLVGGGTFGYTKFFKHHEEPKEKPVAVKPATFVDMPDVLVNLSTANTDRPQYLKVKVVLELPEAELIPKIQPLMPRVMDQFQTYLRELRPTDLEGSAGLYRLKEELTRRVNAAITPYKINAVLFKEIVVQ